jgi:hypothetical protein
MPSDTTTIEVKVETWKALNRRKEPGESFDDVLRRELSIRPAGGESKTQRDTHTAGTADEVALPDDLEAELERWRNEMKRNDVSNIDARVRAARAVGQLVVSEGAARSDAVGQLLPDYRYGDVDESTWWDKVAKRRFGNVESIQWDQSEQEYRLAE